MDPLKSLAFETLTSPDPASGYSFFLAACFEGKCEEVRAILSFSPSLLDTLMTMVTPTLEQAGLHQYQRPVDIVTALSTPAHQAIQNILQQYLDKSCKKTDTGRYLRFSLIHLAAQEGSVRQIKNLFSRGLVGADIDRKGRAYYCQGTPEGSEWSTPLYLAAVYNKPEVIEELLSRGAAVQGNGYTHNVAQHAAERGSTANLLYLLDNDPELANGRYSLLHFAASGGNVDTVAALINIGLDVNEETDCRVRIYAPLGLHQRDRFNTGRSNTTPLMLAAKSGNLETVKLLISKGAKIQTCDEYNCSALFYACNGGHFAVAQFLMKNNVQTTLRDKEGKSLLHVVTDVATADILVSCCGLDVNAHDNKRLTPLHDAAERNEAEITEFLIVRGADVNARDEHHRTPLYLAARYGERTTKLLVEMGADVNARAFRSGTWTDLPLFCAKIRPIVRFLLQQGSEFPEDYYDTAPMWEHIRQDETRCLSLLSTYPVAPQTKRPTFKKFQISHDRVPAYSM